MSFRPVFPVLGKPPLSVRSGNFWTRSRVGEVRVDARHGAHVERIRHRVVVAERVHADTERRDGRRVDDVGVVQHEHVDVALQVERIRRIGRVRKVVDIGLERALVQEHAVQRDVLAEVMIELERKLARRGLDDGLRRQVQRAVVILGMQRRQRQRVGECLSGRVDAIGRDDVAGERRPVTRSVGRQRIVNRNHLAVRVAEVAEVAAAASPPSAPAGYRSAPGRPGSLHRPARRTSCS